MNLKGILGTIGKTALPALAAAVIPGSPLIGIAAKFISDKLGGAPIDATPEAIDKAVEVAHTDPEAFLKLQEADHAFQEYMAKLGFDSAAKIAELANEDRASARAREIAVKDKTPMILAYTVTVGFFGLLACLFRFEVPKDSQPIIYSMVGVLGTVWISVMAYYFGSSSGSAAKTDLLAKQTSTIVDFKKAA
jgi:hypothetical protein